MSKPLIVLVLTVIICGVAWADDVLVTVVNPEPYRFWYVLDPPELASVPPDSPDLINLAASYLTAEGEAFLFEPLEPGQEVVFAGLPPGLHYLFGVFESDLLDDLPVQLMAFEVDSESGDFGFSVDTRAFHGVSRIGSTGGSADAWSP
jgi:hypothetical protein